MKMLMIITLVLLVGCSSRPSRYIASDDQHPFEIMGYDAKKDAIHQKIFLGQTKTSFLKEFGVPQRVFYVDNLLCIEYIYPIFGSEPSTRAYFRNNKVVDWANFRYEFTQELED